MAFTSLNIFKAMSLLSVLETKIFSLAQQNAVSEEFQKVLEGAVGVDVFSGQLLRPLQKVVSLFLVVLRRLLKKLATLSPLEKIKSLGYLVQDGLSESVSSRPARHLAEIMRNWGRQTDFKGAF